MMLRNEFAAVEIELDDSAAGPRLMVKDLRTQERIYLDPLELGELARCRHRDLAVFLDPSGPPERSEGQGGNAAGPAIVTYPSARQPLRARPR